jgi:plastocyanin
VWKCCFGLRWALVCWACSFCALAGSPAFSQQNAVTAHLEIVKSGSTKPEKSSGPPRDASEVAVWLLPLDRSAAESIAGGNSQKRDQLVQKNKSFQPHLLVTQVGSTVNFPNRDPFFHNVFSLFDGKRFDLGLYEAGATNSVRFDHPGISFLFCNIHPEMSAVVVAVETPYFAVSDKLGNIMITNVPDGEYEMHVWYERSLPEDLKSLTRAVSIGTGVRELGTIRIRQNPSFSSGHKNKYGQEYPPPPSPAYSHP